VSDYNFCDEIEANNMVLLSLLLLLRKCCPYMSVGAFAMTR